MQQRALRGMVTRIDLFCKFGSSLKLRGYQLAAAKAVVNSVLHRRGRRLVVVFPRQSGKNELQAQIEAYLLYFYSGTDAEMVKVSPTWKPQSLNAMRRLERVLSRNWLTRRVWHKEQGYIYRIGSARIYFLSGEPSANVVGATASLLLSCDEAQSVEIEKWDREFAPMAASTNATLVFWGTAWTADTLLSREKRHAEALQASDGKRRLFLIDAGEVMKEVPAYGSYVQGEVDRLGRNHPLVRTQYYSEELEQQGGMFTPERLALLSGSHPRQRIPTPGRTYAFLVDIAGEDEALFCGEGELANPGRDSTALTVVEVELGSAVIARSAVCDEAISRPDQKGDCFTPFAMTNTVIARSAVGDEAISPPDQKGDCFTPFAMTNTVIARSAVGDEAISRPDQKGDCFTPFAMTNAVIARSAFGDEAISRPDQKGDCFTPFAMTNAVIARSAVGDEAISLRSTRETASLRSQ